MYLYIILAITLCVYLSLSIYIYNKISYEGHRQLLLPPAGRDAEGAAAGPVLQYYIYMYK